MNPAILISALVLVPLAGFVLTLLLPEKKENPISAIATGTVLVQFLSAAGFSLYAIISGAGPFNIRELTVYRSDHYEFFIDFYFDSLTAVYLLIGSFITLLITRYSRNYMHMEPGFKRFFNSLLFFFLAYNFTVLAGNFESLFLGWEMMGISSFLLIAFYRDRYLPVRNAVKVFSIYRIGDVGILLAMWASHHLWHENVTFMKLSNQQLVHEHLSGHTAIGIFISLGLLTAASAKSALLPFSSWLPRAMEGPTPSSAIFYGSLSAHLGVFLLMRTHNFWENQLTTRILIGAGGFSTAVAGFFIARVQSTIKTQIAWASIGQIGIMFVEISLGLYTLALIHFAGNAFLRTYQLLVSPSVVAYLIREQFYHFKPQQFAYRKSIRSRLRYTLYMLSIKEWGLDKLMTRLAFNPMKKVGRFLDFLKPRNVLFFFVQLYLSGLFLHSHEEKLNESVRHLLPVAFSLVGLIFVLKAFSERKYPRLSLMLIMMNGFWVALAISFNEHYEFSHTLFYLSGIVASGLTGMIALEYLRRREPDYFSLSQYYGHVYEYPRLSLVVLLSCLGIMGFPITTTFIGEDLIFSHIHDDQFLLAAVNSLAFVVDGLAVIKIYTRLFLGPHAKTYHSTALKSA